MDPDWRSTLDGAQKSAGSLGALLASQHAWSDVWVREWAADVTEARASVDAERSGIGAALGYDESGWTAIFWQRLAKAVLLDAAPERGLGAPPKAWADGYLVALEAAGAVRSQAEAESALGLFAQTVGAAVLSAQDVRSAGETAGAAVQAATGFLSSTGGKVVAGGGLLLALKWAFGR
jgi:hypothetical protein